MMQVKSDAMLSLPIFIVKKYGKDGFNKWRNALLPEAKNVYSYPIKKGEWHPLRKMMIEPTQLICDLFYNKSLKGAADCGRFSADIGLKGISKLLVKLSNPKIIINKASKIMPTYYRPSKIEVIESSEGYGIARITQFPESDSYIEYRIAGWMERALEISGCRNVNINITRTLTKGDPYTEYRITWK